MRLIAVIAIGLALAGCGDNSASTKPGDDADPSNAQSSARAGSDDAAGPSDSNGPDGSSAPDDGSGPVLPPLPGSEGADPQGAAAAPNGAGPEQVHVLNWQETLDLVQRQRGKVVVVDLWSHNCLPCLRELPHFSALCREYPEQVACIGFNMDYTGLKKDPPESFVDDVAQTMGKYDAGIINVVSSVPDQELWDQIGLSSVPAVYVFDQQGQQVKRFDNDNSEVEFTYEKDVAPLVEELLDSGSSE